MNIWENKVNFGYSSLADGNLDFRFDDKEIVASRRKEFFARVGIDPAKSVAMIAEHANNMALVTAGDAGKGIFSSDDQYFLDGLITREKNFNLILAVADCIALVLYDEANEVLAMVHVGSKNLAIGTVDKAIQAIKINNSKIHAATSPFIKKCCYRFETIPKHLEALKDYFIEKDGAYFLDTESALQNQLIESGVKEENIEISRLCSMHDNFPSHRNSKKMNLPESRMLVYARML